jgi:hypothetical protein
MRYDQTLLAILSDQDGKQWDIMIFFYIYIVYIYIIGLLEVASWSICAN